MDWRGPRRAYLLFRMLTSTHSTSSNPGVRAASVAGAAATAQVILGGELNTQLSHEPAALAHEEFEPGLLGGGDAEADAELRPEGRVEEALAPVRAGSRATRRLPPARTEPSGPAAGRPPPAAPAVPGAAPAAVAAAAAAAAAAATAPPGRPRLGFELPAVGAAALTRTTTSMTRKKGAEPSWVLAEPSVAEVAERGEGLCGGGFSGVSVWCLELSSRGAKSHRLRDLKTLACSVSGPGSGRTCRKEAAHLPAPGGGGRAVVGAEFDVTGGGRSPARRSATSGRGERPLAALQIKRNYTQGAISKELYPRSSSIPGPQA
ncbi:translation initiation factor IF-2-like [Canis lupus familiaris]|uniref:translation initiation factor IF-2-like n=1 Tax=Canis lupus familiaris TaxID=9615 RepID=UPI0018F65B07|nr:translation initiation factor IF-2-like [Canis lupus familiaris]